MRTLKSHVLAILTVVVFAAATAAVPAGAQAAPQDPIGPAIAELSIEELVDTAESEDPTYGAGFRSRIESLKLIRSFAADINGNDEELVLEHLSKSLADAYGDWLTSDDAFQQSHQGLVHLENWGRKNSQHEAAAEEAAELWALADRVAAVVVLNYVESLLAENDFISNKDLKAVNKDLDKARSELSKGDDAAKPAQAVKRYQAAWRAANLAGKTLSDSADADGDFLNRDIEEALGLDPNSADSDGDGLGDITELWTTGTDPAMADTGNTGQPDGERDPDSDGLTHLEEIAIGSDPLITDTDGDTLDDGFEVNTFNSNPVLVDTDSDGLADDSELRLGTDPNNPDSDGDGILDGDEIYTSVAEFTDTGVSVAITGVGDVAVATSLTDESTQEILTDMPGLASSVVDISTDLEFTEAAITIPFDFDAVPDGDTANLSVFYFDEEGGVFVPVEGEVTVNDDDTVTASTTHFTLFAVFYIPNWFAQFDGWDPGQGGGPGGPTQTFIDITLVLDSSGSMGTNDPQGLRRTASKSFIDALIEGDRVAVIDFDSSAIVRQGLTQDFAAAKAAVDLINSSGGTNISRAVAASNNELINNGDPEHALISILLTDGVGSYSSFYTQQAADNNITIFTIGLGAGVDAALLQGIADGTGGQYFPVATAEQLPDVFSRIPVNLDPAGDADLDGLSNGLEQEGILAGNGILYKTNPLNADTDGDGLLDSEELVDQSQYGPYQYFYSMRSNPLEADTDDDLLLDGEEYEMGLSPRDPDRDNDNLDDGVELAIGFDPFEANIDGDALRDDAEFAQGSDPFVYDLTGADGVRAFVAGALLGQAGQDVPSFDTSLKELIGSSADWINIPYIGATLQTLAGTGEFFVGVGCWSSGVVDFFTGWMGPVNPVAGAEATCDLLEFRIKWVQEWATFLPYMAGWITITLIPFVDIVAGVRDLIANIAQGSWLGAGLEAVFLVIGVLPIGDGPKIGTIVTKTLRKSKTASRAIFKFLATKFDGIFITILKNATEFTDDLILRAGGAAELTRIANNGTDLAKLAKFLKLGGKLERFSVANPAALLQRVGSKWNKARAAAKASTVRRLAAEALSTEAAVSYLTREGFDILYIGRNVPVQIGDDAVTAINKGPDIIAVAPNGRTVIVEVKGSSQVGGTTLNASTITSRVGGTASVQTSLDWITRNAGSRYLNRMRQAGVLDPNLADAANRIDDIILGANYDVIVIGASTNTRIGNVAEALVDASGASKLKNGGSVAVVAVDFTENLLNSVINALK